MPRTLTDDQKDDFYALVLNVDEGAETVTYYPVAGEPRQIVVRIRKHSSAASGQAVDRDLEEITVHVGKDEANAKGGVSAPSRGSNAADSILRSGDAAVGKYSWTGMVVQETPFAWILSFERKRPRIVGTRGA
jgi:hypothetical protein